MARKNSTQEGIDWKALMMEDELFKGLLRDSIQQYLEAEMEELLRAEKWERSEGRRGYRSGYYTRQLVTRVGKIELRVPQDRQGRFSTEIFDRYQRSEKALFLSLAEMYVQGVSTRKVKKITEQLCGHSFSASTVSRVTKQLDKSLEEFAERPLEEDYPYVVLDARYEKVRENNVVRSRAVLVAIGINWDGRRCVLAVELANRESKSSWREFLLRLRQRGLRGVVFVVSDDHAGLRKAIAEVLPEASWQRCYVRTLEEARKDLAAWLVKWQGTYPKLCDWVEENIEETFTFYRLPLQHHKHMKSTNMLERQNEEIKRRTHIIRIFPNAASCLRLVRALAVEMHENWIEATRYLNMDLLKERKKEEMRKLEDVA